MSAAMAVASAPAAAAAAAAAPAVAQLLLVHKPNPTDNVPDCVSLGAGEAITLGRARKPKPGAPPSRLVTIDVGLPNSTISRLHARIEPRATPPERRGRRVLFEIKDLVRLLRMFVFGDGGGSGAGEVLFSRNLSPLSRSPVCPGCVL